MLAGEAVEYVASNVLRYHLHMPDVYPGEQSSDSGDRTVFTWFGDLWCRMFHRKVMMPIHGYYQCRSCFRRIPVTLDTDRPEDDSHSSRQR